METKCFYVKIVTDEEFMQHFIDTIKKEKGIDIPNFEDGKIFTISIKQILDKMDISKEDMEHFIKIVLKKI